MVTPTSVNERIPPRWCRVSGIPTYPAPYPSFGAQTYTYIPCTEYTKDTYDRKYPNPARHPLLSILSGNALRTADAPGCNAIARISS